MMGDGMAAFGDRDAWMPRDSQFYGGQGCRLYQERKDLYCRVTSRDDARAWKKK